jgi:hypothetical protein
LTVVGLLQALKGSPKTSSTNNPALQKSYDTALDFLMEQEVEDGEDNVQDRMIKTPIKQTDLVLLLKEVVQVVAQVHVDNGRKTRKDHDLHIGCAG